MTPFINRTKRVKVGDKIWIGIAILTYVFMGWFLYAPCGEQMFGDCKRDDIFAKGMTWMVSPISASVIGVYYIGELLTPAK